MKTMRLLNDVANDAESIHHRQLRQSTIMIASLKSETMGKLIKSIPASRLLISSLPGRL